MAGLMLKQTHPASKRSFFSEDNLAVDITLRKFELAATFSARCHRVDGSDRLELAWVAADHHHKPDVVGYAYLK
jgi:hypothetical protein